MAKILKILGILLLCIVLLAGLAVGILTLTEYRPADREIISVIGKPGDPLQTGKPLRLLSWNTGYAALGEGTDFFMDGGTMVYTADKETTMENLQGIVEEIRKEAPDFILLQETDKHSARSHYINQNEEYRAAFPEMQSAFAHNFRALFVPYPMPPIGNVESGVLTLSAYRVSSAERISLPTPFVWPVRTVNLKRCLLVTRQPVEGSEHELVLINFHLEAYDNGEGKKRQMEEMAAFLQAEVEKGNWVIAAGDFNQTLAEVLSAYPVLDGEWAPGTLDTALLGDGLTVLMDASAPTCRSLSRPYEGTRDGFQFYMIDGVLVSRGVTVEEIRTVDKDFQYSDHNPVVLSFRLE